METATATVKTSKVAGYRRDCRLTGYALSAAAFAAAFLFVATPVLAEVSVGESAVVVRDVRGTLEATKRKLDNADPVYQDELVETAERSASEIRFLDETGLTVGPGSRVVLDSFLYDPSAPSGTLVIGAAEGVFRFVSGNMPSESYQIRTPEVTVAVRGTVVDFVAVDGATAVVLQSRNSRVIVTSKTGNSVTLDRPGLATVAFENGAITPAGPPPIWSLWKIREMRSLVASVRPWQPWPRNKQIGDSTDPGYGGDATSGEASYADNGFPQGTGAAAGAAGKAICITFC